MEPKTVFLQGNADWVSEITSVIKINDNTKDHSVKMTPSQVSQKLNQKSNFQNKRKKRKTKNKLRDSASTAFIKIVFSQVDSTKWSKTFQAVTQITDDTIPSCRIDYLPKKYKEFLLRPINITLDENNLVIKKLILI